MRGILAMVLGFTGAAAFIGGWLFDPGSKAALVTSLICGFAAILSQMSTRDLLGRTQSLIDRGADEFPTDGGELYGIARGMKERIEKLVIGALVIGALAPFFATLRALYLEALWSALAFAFSIMALALTVGLFAANRSLGSVIDSDRLRRGKEKRAREELLSRKSAVTPEIERHPNLKGYGADKPDAASHV